MGAQSAGLAAAVYLAEPLPRRTHDFDTLVTVAPVSQAIRYVLEDVCYSLRLSPSLPLSSNRPVKTL
jgi:hypothetical protein